MRANLHPSDWRDLPVYFWPLIWWQLFRLRRALAREVNGDQALIWIEPTGRVRACLPRDETDINIWLHIQRTTWPAHFTPMNDPSGEAHLNAIRYWTPRFMERGHLTNFISRRSGFPVAPAIDDSS
ncbi:MAG: hypothetical protein AAFR74_05445 [Pseudomonadota bacterium]